MSGTPTSLQQLVAYLQLSFPMSSLALAGLHLVDQRVVRPHPLSLKATNEMQGIGLHFAYSSVGSEDYHDTNTIRPTVHHPGKQCLEMDLANRMDHDESVLLRRKSSLQATVFHIVNRTSESMPRYFWNIYLRQPPPRIQEHAFWSLSRG